jgi:hypothetical protein
MYLSNERNYKLMKKVWAKALAILLCIAALVSVVGCSAKGKPCMELDGTEMTVNMYQLYLSRMKGTLASGYVYGESALKDSFWDTIMSADGTTYNKHFSSMVLDNTKNYLAALHAFEELGLKLPKSYLDEIDQKLADFIEVDADGSKNTFNSILAKYGVNYKILREAYIIEAKIAYLNDQLYGADGSKIASTLVEEYYQSTYARFKHVFIYTYELIYETDSDGEDVWYKMSDEKKISYDTTKTPKKDADGKLLKDKNGDVIYVNDDGKIAYDKANGKRNPLLDENGNQITREYTKDELIKASDRATLILEQAEENNYTLFDKLVESYGEDDGMTDYKNGYFVTRESNYDSPEVIEALFEMKEGEIKRVDSEYGIHLVMKYELTEGGYSDKDNADFFVSSNTGAYVFMSDLKQMLLAEYIKPYLEKIVVDEAALAGIDIKSVGANFYY